MEHKKCKYCKIGGPKIVKVDANLFYARCNNHECVKWDPYEFLGASVARAYEAWDKANVPATAKKTVDN